MKATRFFLTQLILLCSSLSFSCQGTLDNSTSTIPLTSTLSAPSNVPLLTSTPSPNHETESLRLIGTFNSLGDKPFYFWWSMDSKRLYYSRDASYVFDIETGQQTITEVSRPATLQCPYLPENFNAQHIFRQSCSPTTTKILFETLAEAVEPEPTISTSSLEAYNGHPIDLWIWERSETHAIGRINNCVKEYVWADDEDSLIAIGFDNDFHPVPPICDKESFAWLIDLSAKKSLHCYRRRNIQAT